MPKKKQTVALDDFSFFSHLWDYCRTNRKRIRRDYRELTKKFLDFNDPENGTAFLRQPQFEALEMYVFLKEYLDNRHVHEVFELWRDSAGKFEGREQLSLFEELNKDRYDAVFARMRRHMRAYPNYIFALTMGTGKTILMATCIFYEFLLANKYSQNEQYCHNALVFAPDRTVLQSLREIQTFDLAKVVPPEYVSFLSTNLKFHFLDEPGMALATMDKSRFNIVISNTQKIILKKQNAAKTSVEKLFGSGKAVYEQNSVYAQNEDLYGFDEPEDEGALTTNQRFEKLRRLEQLGIYVDEAHHAFGTTLAKDMGAQESTAKTSLRRTIDELAASLERSGTHVVACYNYTGTPYVGQEILPEVIYAYGLQEAIQNEFLKNIRINGYANSRTSEFVGLAIEDFLKNVSGERYEGLLPKIAFFAATVDELQQELRPAVEKALAEHSIPMDRILANVGDEKITSNDDIREFNRLDTPGSEKQFILLVNKGREGWNCRSLCGVALFRKPNSKIFVLQATMRCLRSITNVQQTGHVYLSEENRGILEDELQQNFRVSIDDIQMKSSSRQTYDIHVVLPPVKVKLTRVKKLFQILDKTPASEFSLRFEDAGVDKYRLIHTRQEGVNLAKTLASRRTAEDLTHLRERAEFTHISLVAEVARYLNLRPLRVEEILEGTAERIDGILRHVNEFNELLYDWVIPRLFEALYVIKEYELKDEYEVELVKIPKDGYYQVQAPPEHVETLDKAMAVKPEYGAKSFHLDVYCFDSSSEKKLFWSLLGERRIELVYFTGMLTHGQSDFYVQYIDPDSHAIRSYYPDFLVQKADGSFVIIEVKADYNIDTPVVRAKKEFAHQMAVASGMRYEIVKSTDADAGRCGAIFA